MSKHPHERDLRRVMGRPLLLGRKQCLQCRPQFALTPRRFEDGDDFVGTIMERRIAQH